MAEAGVRSSSQLPADILGLILLRLADVHTINRFGQVCTAWRSAKKEFHGPSCFPPLLMLRAGKIAPNITRFHLLSPCSPGDRLLRHRIGSYKTSSPAEVIGDTTSMGWMLASIGTGGLIPSMCIMNLVAKQQFSLPSKCSYLTQKKKKLIKFQVYGFTLSSAPTSDDCIVAAAGTTSKVETINGQLFLFEENIVLCCRLRGGEEWTVVETSDLFERCDHRMMCAFHKGRLYITDRDGEEGVTNVYDNLESDFPEARIIDPPDVLHSFMSVLCYKLFGSASDYADDAVPNLDRAFKFISRLVGSDPASGDGAERAEAEDSDNDGDSTEETDSDEDRDNDTAPVEATDSGDGIEPAEAKDCADDRDNEDDSPVTYIYLVESDGELLLVTEILKENPVCPYMPKFCVHKLRDNMWEAVESLGGRVLLLTDFMAESISCKNVVASGYQGNCIYKYGQSGLLKYSLEDWRTLKLPMPEGVSGFPYWIKPQM